jgi:hypothetical protein
MEASDESTAEQKSVNRRERLGRTKAVPILAPLEQGQDNSGTSTPKQGIKVPVCISVVDLTSAKP